MLITIENKITNVDFADEHFQHDISTYSYVLFDMCKPYNYTEVVVLNEIISCVLLDCTSEQSFCYIHCKKYFHSIGDEQF